MPLMPFMPVQIFTIFSAHGIELYSHIREIPAKVALKGTKKLQLHNKRATH